MGKDEGFASLEFAAERMTPAELRELAEELQDLADEYRERADEAQAAKDFKG